MLAPPQSSEFSISNNNTNINSAMLDGALSRSLEKKFNKRESELSVLFSEHSFHVCCVLLDGSTPAKAFLLRMLRLFGRPCVSTVETECF